MAMHPARQAYVEEAQNEDEEQGIDLANIRKFSVDSTTPSRTKELMKDTLAIDRDYLLPQSSSIAPEKASAILAQFDRKRREQTVIVPTDDKRVRIELRKLGEPISLFGERPEDRRQRLRELVTDIAEHRDEGTPDVEMEDADGGDGTGAQEQDEEFYTEGSQELLEARKKIAYYSLPRAKARLALQKEESTITLHTHIRHRKALKDRLSNIELFGSQIAGERAVSITRFSPSGEMIAAGNWAGGVKLLTVPNLDEKMTLRGHTGQVGGISWYPGSTLPSSTVSETAVNLASGAGEGTINLWSLSQTTPLHTLHGHTARVCRIEFHPLGTYLASASYDTTWRLWDIPTQTELLLQEGHSAEVYALAFNTDGSLLASGGLDSIGRVWDLRTGRTIMILDGHIRPIYALDWGRDGYRVLSGSGDGWVKCWDMRMVRANGSVGAHNGNVSDVRWFKGSLTGDPNNVASDPPTMLSKDDDGKLKPPREGTFFVSSGFDNNVNVFSADDWALAKTLSGHSGNVLSVDVDRDARWICSGGKDRTVKLWGREDMEPI
ncbi:MAG: hypothetical protein M1834_004912 [Cirrosporium novae-zelandiae]|nr:MAG: hypothetical protein M1834_004912 [Cirrosporium novae-zelandiae]